MKILQQIVFQKITIKTNKLHPMINILYINKDQTIICEFTGRLGSDHSQEITEAINEKLNELKSYDKPPEKIKIVFDLKKVDFIASAFIRICINTFKNFGRENFSIINTKPIIKKTFVIAGLYDDMNIS